MKDSKELSATAQSRRAPSAGSAMEFVVTLFRETETGSDWIVQGIWSQTAFGAKIKSQSDNPGFGAIRINGVDVLPSPNKQIT